MKKLVLLSIILIVGCENSTESKDVHFTCMYNIYNFTGAGFESSQSDTLLIHSPSLNEAQSDFCSIFDGADSLFCKCEVGVKYSTDS